jgi:3-methylfumaryl-CoA hydratase
MGVNLTDWIGRQAEAADVVTAIPARALAATLGLAEADAAFAPGAELPPLWIWLYFLPLAPASEVGPDGHPKRGHFLPPITLPRRMWAGSRCTFHAPIRIGDEVSRVSTILNVAEKSGKAGDMVFVTVRHLVSANGTLAFEEEQDIVYVGIPERFSPPAAAPVPPCDWREDFAVDPVVLFRFSALTFNGHRIHYDRPYATDVEKYPGLVVHGPLQAMALMGAALRHAEGRAPRRYEFRGMRPLFDFDAVSLNGVGTDNGMDLFTSNAEGATGMKASVTWDG